MSNRFVKQGMGWPEFVGLLFVLAILAILLGLFLGWNLADLLIYLYNLAH